MKQRGISAWILTKDGTWLLVVSVVLTIVGCIVGAIIGAEMPIGYSLMGVVISVAFMSFIGGCVSTLIVYYILLLIDWILDIYKKEGITKG